MHDRPRKRQRTSAASSDGSEPGISMGKRSDNMIKYSPFLAAEVAPKGEIVTENDMLVITCQICLEKSCDC
jgi:hypothetical protein